MFWQKRAITLFCSLLVLLLPVVLLLQKLQEVVVIFPLPSKVGMVFVQPAIFVWRDFFSGTKMLAMRGTGVCTKAAMYLFFYSCEQKRSWLVRNLESFFLIVMQSSVQKPLQRHNLFLITLFALKLELCRAKWVKRNNAYLGNSLSFNQTASATVVCILVRIQPFLRFWRNHS